MRPHLHGSAAVAAPVLALWPLLFTCGCACSQQVVEPPAKAAHAPAARPAPAHAAPPAGPAGAMPAKAAMPLEEWNRQYGDLLAEHVSTRSGAVDYAGLRDKHATVRALAAALAPPRRFETHRHRLAFVINAYNLLVIANVLEHGPIASPGDVRGFFDGDRFTVLGEAVTLAQLRDRGVRTARDPRALLALCDAARGSPPLRAEPYTPQDLDAQLDAQARRFVNDPVRNARVGDMALISPLFDRFAADFRDGPFRSLDEFLHHHADPATPLGRLLHNGAATQFEYQHFNWALNE